MGLRKITVLVPQWKSTVTSEENTGPKITDQYILDKLHDQNKLTYTPSTRIGKEQYASYDDRYV